uniref:Ig-like domain-containing protein n=1 Tax=Nothoprocta perdicaria TaxID=30464 RepID=A0A8C6Z7R8_NOTPE
MAPRAATAALLLVHLLSLRPALLAGESGARCCRPHGPASWPPAVPAPCGCCWLPPRGSPTGAVARPRGRAELRQPQAALDVLVGQTLTLHCTVAGDALAGAVKWLKASGGRNRTVYDQRSPQPRVARAASGSNTDFTIHIHDARPDDAGTYYCVKLRADKEDEVSCSGGGTTVSVHGERGCGWHHRVRAW